MASQEVHISSMVVQTSPDGLSAVRNSIERLPGAEIHGESKLGKLVVVLESGNQAYITDIIDKINNLENVLSTSLVYHHIEQLDSPRSDRI